MFSSFPLILPSPLYLSLLYPASVGINANLGPPHPCHPIVVALPTSWTTFIDLWSTLHQCQLKSDGPRSISVTSRVMVVYHTIITPSPATPSPRKKRTLPKSLFIHLQLSSPSEAPIFHLQPLPLIGLGSIFWWQSALLSAPSLNSMIFGTRPFAPLNLSSSSPPTWPSPPLAPLRWCWISYSVASMDDIICKEASHRESTYSWHHLPPRLHPCNATIRLPLAFTCLPIDYDLPCVGVSSLILAKKARPCRSVFWSARFDMFNFKHIRVQAHHIRSVSLIRPTDLDLNPIRLDLIGSATNLQHMP